MMLNEQFLKKLCEKNKLDDASILKYINYAKVLCKLDYFDVHFEEQSINETIHEASDILSKVDLSYNTRFKKMLIEENCDNPYIMILNSMHDVSENESVCHGHEVFFYKTNTSADTYLLLHEFTHYLINMKKSYGNNKINNEVAPILSEFLVFAMLNRDSFIEDRLNSVINNAKTLLGKIEIYNGNYNLDDIYIKYNYSNSDISKFEYELYTKKNITIHEEMSYINGFVCALDLKEGNIIDNYKNVVLQLAANRDYNFEIDNYEELIKRLSNNLNNKEYKIKHV